MVLVLDVGDADRALVAGLRRARHEVALLNSAEEALALCHQVAFDLLLLTNHGAALDQAQVELCGSLRAGQPDAVLVVLAEAWTQDLAAAALDAGADDLLPDTTGTVELAARVRAHIRRGRVPTSPGRVHTVGELRIDTGRRIARLAGQEFSLPAKEFDVLSRLASEHGGAVSRWDLMIDVWGKSAVGSTKSLDVHMSTLRRHLQEVADSAGVLAPRIVTVRGHGFRLQLDDAATAE